MVNNAGDFASSAGGCGFSKPAGFNLAFTIRHYEEVLYGSDVSLATVIVAANWCGVFFFFSEGAFWSHRPPLLGRESGH